VDPAKRAQMTIVRAEEADRDDFRGENSSRFNDRRGEGT